MEKTALGKRLLCPHCGVKFYDMNRPEPACPKCGTLVSNFKFTKPSIPKITEIEIEPDDIEIQPDDDIEVMALDNSEDDCSEYNE
ncbi:TIGR02300 family protein [bacterium]|nr:TIGR02300 family protein [candidate division CSSED10-310 bacterium]